MAKKKVWVWGYSQGNKPDVQDLEHYYANQKAAMEDALSDLEADGSVTIFKAEIKKVGTYKQKLVKI